MHRICVFCGSNPGIRPAYVQAARTLGETIARQGRVLVYGGAGVGLMAELADAALHAGGQVIGVITRGLIEHEVAHRHLSDLRIVETMHERKALMAELSDAFIALPGGLGTLDELFEMLTWAQLGLCARPCGILDVHGYFASLDAFLDHAVAEGFVHPEHRNMLRRAETASELLEQLAAWDAPRVSKWLGSGPRP